MLKEKHSYKFLLIKTIEINGEELYVLEDPFGKRHTLPTIYYTHYQLNVPSEVVCKIDKINCTGRIFLEPEHPFYKIGGIYQFKIIEIRKIEDTLYRYSSEMEYKSYEIVVTDCNNQPHYVTPYRWQLHKKYNAQYINCVVLRITAGKFHLKNLDKQHPYFKIGEEYKFKFIKIKNVLDENNNIQVVCELKGTDGYIYTAPAELHQLHPKYKKNYIVCKIMDIESGDLILEQLNV